MTLRILPVSYIWSTNILTNSWVSSVIANMLVDLRDIKYIIHINTKYKKLKYKISLGFGPLVVETWQTVRWSDTELFSFQFPFLLNMEGREITPPCSQQAPLLALPVVGSREMGKHGGVGGEHPLFTGDSLRAGSFPFATTMKHMRGETLQCPTKVARDFSNLLSH